MPIVRSVGVSLPDFIATNSRIKDLVLSYSSSVWGSKQEELEDLIDEFFVKSGAQDRIWRSSNTLPKIHLKEAVESCLSLAGNEVKEQISSIIFCGIDRGFVEPAHVSALAAQIDMNDVRAFDIADACLGWFTACQAARSFASIEKPLSLIVSAEFPMDDPGLVLPEAFKIKTRDEFEWKSAALTLGEMATATLIDAYVSPLDSTIKSQNQHNQLCVVPIKKPHRFMDWNSDTDHLERGCFIANGMKLAATGFRPGLAVLQGQIEKQGEPDFIIPHAFSQTVPQIVADRLGVGSQLHNVFERVGNISTSSIPFGLWSLSKENHLDSKNIMGWVASAGMKHAAFEIAWEPFN